MKTIKGKTVLVTGGTGSFGRHVVGRLISEKVREIRIFSRDEKKQFDMKNKFSSVPNLKFFLGDVRDAKTVREVVCGVDVVFHAAALKQVPHCERFPMEAVATNVYGAKNVIDAALEEGVDRVVCISTDKAVQPVNVMGMSKAIQEKLLTSANDSPRNKGTRLVGVRYGNVLNSRASVVPFFRELIRKGEVLTITSEEMTRFLLTLNQAVDLVFYACEHGHGGEIFVRKAASARVMDIARAVCEISGSAFRHKVIGRYGGEKLHEILISEEERTRCEEKDDYFLINRWRQSTSEKYGAGEYSSADVVIPLSDVRRMIEESDRDEQEVEFEDGVFYR